MGFEKGKFMKLLTGVMAASLLSIPAVAAPAIPPTPGGLCWEVYMPHIQSDYPILLNKCTSDSWLLARHPAIEQAGGAPTADIYTWDKINVGQAANRFPIKN